MRQHIYIYMPGWLAINNRAYKRQKLPHYLYTYIEAASKTKEAYMHHNNRESGGGGGGSTVAERRLMKVIKFFCSSAEA